MDLTDDLELVCAAYPEATIEYGTNNQPNHVLVPTEYDKTSLKLIYRRSTTNNTDLTPVLSRSAQRHVVVESKQYSLKLINSINANIAEEITRLSSDIEEDQSSFCLIQLATSILHVHIQNSSKSLVTSAPNSLLRTAQPTDSASLTTITAPVTVTVTASKTIARMLVYFHHIKSPAKKKDIVSNAAELQLCGLWKEGFPGIVIIEGEKDSCLEVGNSAVRVYLIVLQLALLYNNYQRLIYAYLQFHF